MKKSLLGIPFFCMAFGACSSDVAVVEPDSPHRDVEKVQVTVKGLEAEDDVLSRLVVENGTSFKWAALDTIGIFPTQGGQVEFPITEESVGSSTAYFEGGGWALKAGYSYSAYFPYNFYNRNSTEVPVSYLGQEQDGIGNSSHLTNFTFLAAAPTPVENGALDFTLMHIGTVMNLNLIFSRPETYTSATVYTDAKVFPVRKTVNLQDSELAQTVLELSDSLTIRLKNVTTTHAGDTVPVWLVFPSVNEPNYPLKVVVVDADGYKYTSDIRKKDETAATADFNMHKFQRRYANPVLDEGVHSGIGGWGSDGKDYGGSAE